jgi:hypothetical protein
MRGVRWVGDDSHLVFRQKLLGEDGIVRRDVVTVKKPGLFSPKFGATSSHVFTESPQNVAVEPGIHSLACWVRCFALPQLLYRWHKSRIFFGYHLVHGYRNGSAARCCRNVSAKYLFFIIRSYSVLNTCIFFSTLNWWRVLVRRNLCSLYRVTRLIRLEGFQIVAVTALHEHSSCSPWQITATDNRTLPAVAVWMVCWSSHMNAVLLHKWYILR